MCRGFCSVSAIAVNKKLTFCFHATINLHFPTVPIVCMHACMCIHRLHLHNHLIGRHDHTAIIDHFVEEISFWEVVRHVEAQ